MTNDDNDAARVEVDREALAAIILRWMEAADAAGIDGPHSADVADSIIASGFRRSQATQPVVVSAEQVDAATRRADASSQRYSLRWRMHFLTALGIKVKDES